MAWALAITLKVSPKIGFVFQKTVAQRTLPGFPPFSLTHTHTHTRALTHPPPVTHSQWACVWDCLCPTGTWVHAEVRRCARTWWNTTSWLLWQRYSERWGPTAAFSLPHHFASSSSAAVGAGRNALRYWLDSMAMMIRIPKKCPSPCL